LFVVGSLAIVRSIQTSWMGAEAFWNWNSLVSGVTGMAEHRDHQRSHTDSESFTRDVFLSHSSHDTDVVRELAERLRGDGVRVWPIELHSAWEIQLGDSIPSKIEAGLQQSRVLVLCMSQHAFGSDWAALESQTFRFRDPLNKQRRFIPLRLDATPAPGSLGQFLYADWRGAAATASIQAQHARGSMPSELARPEGRAFFARLGIRAAGDR
jgi:hypothetical protein